MGTIAKNNKFYSGPRGKSAYEIAVKNGFEGTEQEWLESLKATGEESGDNNTIESISLNGTEISPDVNKNVNIEVPIFDGDADTLDGHDSEYFAKADELVKYLPLTGGMITSPNGYPIQLNRTGEDAETNVIDFQVNGVRQGMLGFSGVNNAILRDVDGNYYKLLHVGNMAEHVLALSGGIMTGPVTFKSVDNGSCGINKVHTEDSDQGMLIQDVDKDNNIVAIKLCASTGKATFHKDATGSEEILHTGNYSDHIQPFTGAASNVAGTEGLVPAPSSGNVNRMLRADGTWALPGLYKVSAETIAQGSSITVTGSGIEIWTFVSGGPGIALIYVAKNTSGGLAYTKIADLTGGTGADATLNISITNNTPPHSVTITNNNTSSGVTITLTRYAFS